MAKEFLIKKTMVDMRNLCACEIAELQDGTSLGVQLLGYYQAGDTPNPINYYLSSTTEPDDGGSVIETGGIKLEHNFGGEIPVLYYGAKGDDTFDNNPIFLKIKERIIARSNNESLTVFFHKGVYKYSDIGRVAYSNITWAGEGIDNTVLKSISGDIAFNMDARFGETTRQPFCENCNIENLTISGHRDTKVILKQNLTSRGFYENVNLINANSVDGIGLETSNMVGTFKRVFCSVNKNPMENLPFLGLKLVEGFRPNNTGTDESVGRATNNTFISCYWEGMPQGVYIEKGDNNNFIGGSPEANSIFSLKIDDNNKGNSFLGVGFESKNAPYEIYDGGWMSNYIGCYSSNKVVVASTSRNFSWSGGLLQNVELESGSSFPYFANCHYHHNVAITGALINNGAIKPEYVNVYDRANGQISKGYTQTVNEWAFGGLYSAPSGTTTSTRLPDVQEYIESNATTGNQVINLVNGPRYVVGVTKVIRKNSPTGVVSIIAETGVKINGVDGGTVNLNDQNEILIFFCTSPNTWRYYRINTNYASTTNAGVVKKATISADVAAIPSAAYSQAEVESILMELRDLKNKLRVAGILAT
ncbi:hypothetical protein [Sphingobacterium multivorum]|uniref:hypothetical protein n=1 Tax=Sphingobacterium multivorum TaxID=28454 RepID=UPI0028AEEC4D|nr:hypothetical protein [Sphingobacterium multivorum]